MALGVLGLVVGLLILSWVISFTQSLFTPWKTHTNIKRNYIWDTQFNINLLFRSKNISVVSLNPKQGRIVIINIPDEVFLEVPHGFNFWQLRAVYELGQSQKQVGGHKLLVDSLQVFLAIPIDGYLDFSAQKPAKSSLEVVETLRKNPFSGFNLLSGLKTNLTMWEILRLKFSIAGIRFDKVKSISLDKFGVLENETLPDGTPVFTADPVKLDSVLSDLADPAITEEHKTIAVFNATDRPQLAQKAARLITNLGGNVIITANAGERLKKTQVAGEKSATLKRLKQIFNLDDKISSSSADTASRAEVNLFLGEDFDK